MLEVIAGNLLAKEGETIRQILNYSKGTSFTVARHCGRVVANAEKFKDKTIEGESFYEGLLADVFPHNARAYSPMVDWVKLNAMGLFEAPPTTPLPETVAGRDLYRVRCDRDLLLIFSIAPGKAPVTKKIKKGSVSGMLSANILNRMVVAGNITSFWSDEDSVAACHVAATAVGYIGVHCVLVDGFFDRSHITLTEGYVFEIRSSYINEGVIDHSIVDECDMRPRHEVVNSLLQRVRSDVSGRISITDSSLFNCTVHNSGPAAYKYTHRVTVINFCDLTESSVKRSTLHNVDGSVSKIIDSTLSGTILGYSTLKKCNIHGSAIDNSKLESCVGTGYNSSGRKFVNKTHAGEM